MASSGIISFLDLIFRVNAHYSGSLLLHFLDEPSDSFADANAKKDLRREVLSRSKDCPHPSRTAETFSLTILLVFTSSPPHKKTKVQ